MSGFTPVNPGSSSRRRTPLPLPSQSPSGFSLIQENMPGSSIVEAWQPAIYNLLSSDGEGGSLDSGEEDGHHHCSDLRENDDHSGGEMCTDNDSNEASLLVEDKGGASQERGKRVLKVNEEEMKREKGEFIVKLQHLLMEREETKIMAEEAVDDVELGELIDKMSKTHENIRKLVWGTTRRSSIPNIVPFWAVQFIFHGKYLTSREAQGILNLSKGKHHKLVKANEEDFMRAAKSGGRYPIATKEEEAAIKAKVEKLYRQNGKSVDITRAAHIATTILRTPPAADAKVDWRSRSNLLRPHRGGNSAPSMCSRSWIRKRLSEWGFVHVGGKSK